MNLNKAQLIGRLTRDPEMKALPNGNKVTNFSVATSYNYKNQAGEKVDKVEYHNCVAFNRTGEVIAQYLRKGSLVFVEGRIETRSWDDKTTGEKKYRTEIMVDHVQLPPKSMNPQGADDGHAPDEDAIDFGTSTPEKPKKAEVKGRGYEGEVHSIDYGDANINIDDIPF